MRYKNEKEAFEKKPKKIDNKKLLYYKTMIQLIKTRHNKKDVNN